MHHENRPRCHPQQTAPQGTLAGHWVRASPPATIATMGGKASPRTSPIMRRTGQASQGDPADCPSSGCITVPVCTRSHGHGPARIL